MAANSTTTRDRIVTILDSLSDEALSEVVNFLEYQQFKSHQAREKARHPVPVKLGGLWAGVHITDEDIQDVRREMWDGIEDRFK